MGGIGSVNTGGASGKDDSLRILFENFLNGRGKWQDFAIDLAFADAPGDQLAILGPKIQNENRVVMQRKTPKEDKNSQSNLTS